MSWQSLDLACMEATGKNCSASFGSLVWKLTTGLFTGKFCFCLVMIFWKCVLEISFEQA